MQLPLKGPAFKGKAIPNLSGRIAGMQGYFDSLN